jgi:Tfp pilus assembly protein PilV
MMRLRDSFQRGVSLIEALVAMAVMAFGMLGIIGVQSTLRLNSDVAKQRSEAVRIAEQTIERARSFTSTEAVTGQHDYTDIINVTNDSSDYVIANINTNTVYLIDVAQTPLGDPLYPETQLAKRLRVTVRWADRTNANPLPNSTNQFIVMDTMIAKVMPELGGTLAVSSGVGMNGVTLRGPSGRHVAIPTVGVADNGNGTTNFTPPGTTGVTWIFDNSTALIRISGDPLCSSGGCMLLRGYIRFASGNPVGQSENPLGTSPSPSLSVSINQVIENIYPLHGSTVRTVNCYIDSTANPSGYAYYCAIAPTGTRPISWSGQSLLNGFSLSTSVGDTSTGNFRVCRYTPQRGIDPVNGRELGDYPANGNNGHPYSYDQVTSALINQNFLVINAGDGTNPYACPMDSNSADFINGNTWQHQPHS